MNWIALYLMLYYHRQHAELRQKPRVREVSPEYEITAEGEQYRVDPQIFLRVYNTYTSSGEYEVLRMNELAETRPALGEMK